MLKLPEYVIKRNGSIMHFNKDKIHNAITRAVQETNEFSSNEVEQLVDHVLYKISELSQPEELTVETTQDLVEESLIEMNFPQTAKAYILYRQRRIDSRKPDIFKKRVALKPYEYPHLAKYVQAMRETFWVHTSYNYTADVKDYQLNVTEEERNVIKNAMLAISQIEVSVKTFWGDIYHRLPKPEIASVGATFSESEVRHLDAYSHLLDLLKLNYEFARIHKIPALMKRVKYLDQVALSARTGEKRDYALSLLLFSSFIEHVSLFSQFLIIMSFNKHKNMFPGISNAIEATSKEEELHGLFGRELIHIIRDENPLWFDKDLENEVYEACRNAYESEIEIVDWIYEKGDLDFMPKATVKEYIKHRLNKSLEGVNYEPIFDVDKELLNDTLWFDEELDMTKVNDHFNKKNTAYTDHVSSVTAADIF